MKKVWENVLAIFFLCHRFEIQTKLSTESILKRVERFVCEYDFDYYGWLEDDGFMVAERPLKIFSFGRSKNSQVPVACAKIKETDSLTTVFVTLRANRIGQISGIFLHLISLISFPVFTMPEAIVVILFLIFFDYVGVFRPAKRLKRRLIDLLGE